jgi:crotonyl-CoA carboxylase/reductase
MSTVLDLPADMSAQVIREDRFGTPLHAFRAERIATPPLAPDEVLLRVRAAGVNPNGVWAALGRPLNVIRYHQRRGLAVDYHVAGSDASGTIAALGAGVERLELGQEVVVHGGVWSRECEHVRSGGDPVLSPSMRAFGYQTPWGSFAEYSVVQDHQCLPRPPALSWEASAAYMTAASTAYRMLFHWHPHVAKPGDVVLVWGAGGGVGSMAVQLARAAGAIPIGVASNAERRAFAVRLGALGCVDRTRFDHWGRLPEWDDARAYERWLAGAHAFRRAIWELLGEKRDPTIVVEHPGEDTLATSMYVCAPGGMVVTCAGTSGYVGSLDLRSTWTFQKRLQGSHGMSDADAAAVNTLVARGELDPCLSRVFAFGETAEAHQLLHENRHPPGNMVVRVTPAT